MHLQFRSGEREHTKEMIALEARLERLMPMVEPRPEFTANLKRSLVQLPETTLRVPEQGILQYIVWGTAGLLSGALILVFGIKAVAGLIGSIQQVKKQVEQNTSTSLGSAT
jgi:hypothetical protein